MCWIQAQCPYTLNLQHFDQLGFRRPSAAKTLAGSWGGDQSGRINSSHSVIQEFARSDWMRLSGGDQSERINSSHSVIQEFARFKGLFIYYIISDGGGLPDLLQYYIGGDLESLLRYYSFERKVVGNNPFSALN